MNRELLLSSILDCGTLDLSILDRVNYDWDDVLKNAKENFEKITLETLFLSVVDLGIFELVSSIDNKIYELKKEIMNTEDEERIEELENIIEDIKKLEPQDDFDVFFNFIDTHIYLNKNHDIYSKYFAQELEVFENNTGFEVEY